MKRCLALVLSVVLVLTMMLLFASCDSGRADGYYVIINANIDGKDYPAGDELVKLQNSAPALDNFYVKFAGDGQGELCFFDDPYTMTYDDKSITVNDAVFEYAYKYAMEATEDEPADNVFEYTYSNNCIVLKDVVVEKGKGKNIELVSADLTLKYCATLDGEAVK